MPDYDKSDRLVISHKKEELLICISPLLSSRLLSSQNTPIDIQVIPFELNLRKRSGYLGVFIGCHSKTIYIVENLSLTADHYSSIFNNYIILGDVNVEPNCSALTSFMQSLNLLNVIKTNTCFKGKDDCVDLILTNRKYCFKLSSTFETGLSDHHHLVYSMLKTCCKRAESKCFVCCDYKNFNDKIFRMDQENKFEKCPKHCESFKKYICKCLRCSCTKQN